MTLKPDPIETHSQRWAEAKAGRSYWSREMRIDKRFKAAKLWTPEELNVFFQDGRVATNYDLIGPMVDIVLGLESQSRSDLKVLPRTEKDVASSEALTKILKYVADQNDIDRVLTRTFDDCVSLGVGWLEVGYNPDPMAERIMVGHVPADDIWVDPTSKKPDLSDARDVFRAVWMSPEDLGTLFPKHAESLASGAYNPDDEQDDNAGHEYTLNNGDRPPIGLWEDYGYGQDLDYGRDGGGRKMVRAVERWYRQDEPAMFARYKDGRVEEITPDEASEIAADMLAGKCQRVRGIAKRIRVAIFVGSLLLQDSPSPYDHGRFPFVPMHAYRDEKDRPMGLVRRVRDAAKEYNARRTHMLHKLLSTQVLYEPGSFPNPTLAREELAKPNAMIEVSPGALSGHRIEFRQSLEANPGEVQLMEQAQKMVTDNSGVTQELLGQATNAQSGVAIQQRQAQGQATLYGLFDSRNRAQKHSGELILSLIQSTYTEEQSIRITGGNQGLEWVTVNKKDPETGEILTDITQGRFDLIITEVPAHASQLQAQAELVEKFLSGAPPQVRLGLLPELIRGGVIDLPNAAEMADKVQQIVQQMQAPPPPQGPQERIRENVNFNFKDLTPDEQAQAVQQIGLNPTPPQMRPAVQPPQAPGGPPGMQPPPGQPPGPLPGPPPPQR